MKEGYTLKLTLREKITLEMAVSNQMILLHNECKRLDGRGMHGIEKIQNDRLKALKELYNSINKDKQNQMLSNADEFLQSVDQMLTNDKARRMECGF